MSVELVIERDREAALRDQPHVDPLCAIWNPGGAGAAAPLGAATLGGPEFIALSGAAREEFGARGIWDAQRHVLNRVAARLDRRGPSRPTSSPSLGTSTTSSSTAT